MADRLRLRIYTPDRQVADLDVQAVTAPATLGEIGVLPDHAALATSIEADLAFFDDPDDEKADRVDGAIGELSTFHATYGYYAQGVSVSTATLPAGWRDRLVALATPSTIPVKPRKGMNIFMGLMVGILTGMGVAFVQNQRDRSLKGPQDVKRYLPSRSLHGMIPLLDAKDVWDHHMAAAENYRMVRTSVLLSIPDRCVTALLVTSPGVGEGKTTLAINLGMVMAQLENMRVILIDADVRRPMLQRAFFDDGERRKGLAHFLSGKAGFEEIVHATKIPNLWVVPHGRIPHNPAELLHSGRMAALLARCLSEGYRVIVDAPPVLCVTDPMILASQVDGVLFAVSAGKTDREACRLAMEQIEAAGGKILGMVMQKVRLHETPYYYRADYYLPYREQEAPRSKKSTSNGASTNGGAKKGARSSGSSRLAPVE